MYKVPYGKKELTFDLPQEWKGAEIISNRAKPLKDVNSEIAAALENTVDSPPLAELAQRGQKVCIAFTDITRSCPDSLLLPPVLKILEKAGVRDEDITFLCAVGMHRASTFEEKLEKLGRKICKRYRIIDHQAQNRETLIDLGVDRDGIPLSVNRIAYESDLLISTGIVEPHQYAGYSGGGKTISIGSGGEKFIHYTHGPLMLEREGTRLGVIAGNPFRKALNKVAKRSGLNFIINVVQNDKGEIVCVKAGDPVSAFEELVLFARSIYEVRVPKQYDVAIAGIGYPKDSNLYQASRAASYLFFAPIPLVTDGGVIIIPAPCFEGAGEGVGEKRFLQTMREAPDMRTILEDARRHGYSPGQQRAFIMAKVLEKVDVIIVGADDEELIRSAKFRAASTMEDSFRMIRDEKPCPLDVAVVPHALLTLPVVMSNGS